MFDAVRGLQPPDDLLQTVMVEAETTPQQRGLRFSWLRSAGMVAAAAAILILAIGTLPWIGRLSQSPFPAGSATSSAQETPIHATPAEISQLPLSGSVERQVAVPEGAYPASADATSVWLGHESTGEVLRFDVGGGQVAGRVQVNEPTTEPYDLWPISDGTSVWTAGIDDRSLVRIDIGTMEVADRWPIDAVPYRIAPADVVVWVTDFDNGHVLQIDAESGDVLARIDVRRPTGIAVTPEAIWVAGYEADLVRIDPTSGSVTASYRIARTATDLFAVGDELWIAGINNRRLERFDTTRGSIAAWTDRVRAVAFLEGRPWAAVPSGAVVSLDPTSLEWIGAIPLGEVTTDQLVAAEGRLWAYGATTDETWLFEVRPATD